MNVVLVTALDAWREKLAFFEREAALVTDPERKFELQNRIAEAKAKITELAESSFNPASSGAVEIIDGLDPMDAASIDHLVAKIRNQSFPTLRSRQTFGGRWCLSGDGPVGRAFCLS